MTTPHTITLHGRRVPLAPLLKGAHPTVTRSVLITRLRKRWSRRRARQTPYHPRPRPRYRSFAEAVAAYLQTHGGEEYAG